MGVRMDLEKDGLNFSPNQNQFQRALLASYIWCARYGQGVIKNSKNRRRV
jgi:hypothetical protein